jgi:hypothetical protein
MSVEMPLEKLKHVRLMIGTPVYGLRCHGAYLQSILSLLQLCGVLGIQMGVSSICSESLLQRSRNYVVDEFIRSGCTHLMFVDTDICFHPEYVIALLLLDKDVIGAPYPNKAGIDWETIARTIHHGGCEEQDLHRVAGDLVFGKNLDPSKLVEVDVIKPGFMMIKRRVFDKLQLVYPENYYRPDHIGITHFDGIRNIQMFFSVEIDPDTRKLLTEYEYFCKLWRGVGGQIYMCPWMVLTHIGTHMY